MIRGRLLIAGLTLLPKGLLSRLTGRLVALPLPQFLRRGIIGAFARAFGADPTQAERDLAEYRSIADFFIRRLKSGARVVDASPNALVSPADGRLLLAGVIEAGSALQIKGKPDDPFRPKVKVAVAMRLFKAAFKSVVALALAPEDQELFLPSREK